VSLKSGKNSILFGELIYYRGYQEIKTEKLAHGEHTQLLRIYFRPADENAGSRKEKMLLAKL